VAPPLTALQRLEKMGTNAREVRVDYEVTEKEVADELGVCRQRVNQLEVKGLAYLRYCVYVLKLAEEAGLEEDVRWLESLGFQRAA
jgi:DNA-directed RNA polymerase sigma subunit (sigma70/sigma32)